jgi:hypothetical protein
MPFMMPTQLLWYLATYACLSGFMRNGLGQQVVLEPLLRVTRTSTYTYGMQQFILLRHMHRTS